MCVCVCVCVRARVTVRVCEYFFPEWLVVINGLSLGWKNINPKLNLDELPQINEPEGNHKYTHTACSSVFVWTESTD